MKPKVLHHSSFGDDHHASIDAQVEMLEGEVSEEEIEDKRDNEDWAENVCDSAREAAEWMGGYEKEPPSKNWESLVR